VGLSATAIGLDRDRGFYPTVTIVIASYYALFAVMGASTNALVLESAAAQSSLQLQYLASGHRFWVVVLALTAHGVFDLEHSRVILNPGVPSWWPGFCLTYDATAAAYLAWLLKTDRIRASA
jgi:hypothetical protein